MAQVDREPQTEAAVLKKATASRRQRQGSETNGPIPNHWMPT